jgi:hypothetical protein
VALHLLTEDGAEGYLSLGEEIESQVEGRVDAFIHTVSTAHSLVVDLQRFAEIVHSKLCYVHPWQRVRYRSRLIL